MLARLFALLSVPRSSCLSAYECRQGCRNHDGAICKPCGTSCDYLLRRAAGGAPSQQRSKRASGCL
eukprot:14014690-Alexandrium_andersonii.AAC.1